MCWLVVLSTYLNTDIFAQTPANNQPAGDTLKYTINNCVNTFSIERQLKGMQVITTGLLKKFS
jgi:hypothetical protein